MKESSIFVFDISKESNLVPLNAYCLILYIAELFPTIPGILLPCANYGFASFSPAILQRDDHLILVKIINQFEPQHMNHIIEVLCDNLGDHIFIKIGQMMQKMITTINIKKLKKKQGLFVRICKLVLIGTITKETKNEILHLWFSDAIVGPIFITRSLDLIKFDEPMKADSICCEITNKLKKKIGDSFWNFSMDHVILMDKHYFVIDGQNCKDMDYPKEITCNYIGLRYERSKIQPVKETFLHDDEKKYLKNFEENDYNSFHVRLVKTKSGLNRLKLQYGHGVFYGIFEILVKIINGVRFDEWRKNTPGVGWELWFGRDEQSKLKDYRMMKEENVKLQREIEKLRKLLKNQSNESQ